MRDKKISVIMPVYNVAGFVEKSVKSVLQQTYENIELILIDDGSTDGSENICLRLAQSDKRIELIRKENQGVSAARNDGIDIATGEYITFADSDDWVEPDSYEKMIEYLHDTNSDICVMGFITEGSRSFSVSLKKEEKQVFNRIEAVDNLIDGKIFTWSIGDKIYSRSVLKNVKFPNNVFNGEDFLFNWQVFRKAKKIAYIPLHGYHYVERSDSMVNTFSERKLTVKNAFECILNDCRNDKILYKKIQTKYIETLVGLIYYYFKGLDSCVYTYRFRELSDGQRLLRSKFYNILWCNMENKFKILAFIIMLPEPITMIIFKFYFWLFSK